eukprot:scaffold60473_cov31-Tisochrysis_lutea.AAC.1
MKHRQQIEDAQELLEQSIYAPPWLCFDPTQSPSKLWRGLASANDGQCRGCTRRHPPESNPLARGTPKIHWSISCRGASIGTAVDQQPWERGESTRLHRDGVAAEVRENASEAGAYAASSKARRDVRGATMCEAPESSWATAGRGNSAPCDDGARDSKVPVIREVEGGGACAPRGIMRARRLVGQRRTQPERIGTSVRSAHDQFGGSC